MFMSLLDLFFRKVYAKDKTEASAMVFYNEKDDDFEVWIPSQVNSTANSKYKRAEDPLYLEKCQESMLVMVAHSHPWKSTTPPGPSGTDNNDEKESLLYMILSNVEGVPTYILSTCPNGKRITLRFDTIFELPEMNLTRAEKIELLKKQKNVESNKILDVFFEHASEEDFEDFFMDKFDLKSFIDSSYKADVSLIPDCWMDRCSIQAPTVNSGWNSAKQYNNTYYNNPKQTKPVVEKNVDSMDDFDEYLVYANYLSGYYAEVQDYFEDEYMKGY